MAKLTDVPGLKAEVVVDGKPLREYNDPDPFPPKTVSKYVEATSGVEFEIFYKFRAPFPRNRTISMKVTVDGRELDEPLIPPRDLFDKNGHTSTGPISTNGEQFSVQRFCFSDLNTKEGHEDEITEELKESLSLIGTITLSFYFLENPTRNTHSQMPRKVMDSMDTVPEKAVKGEALSHQVSLRPARNTLRCDIVDADYADYEPFATMHFHYRSITSLKSLMIVPRTAEDMAAVDLENMTAEQLRLMVRDMRLRAEISHVRVKRERDDSAAVGGSDDVLFVKRRKKFPLRKPTRRDTIITIDD